MVLPYNQSANSLKGINLYADIPKVLPYHRSPNNRSMVYKKCMALGRRRGGDDETGSIVWFRRIGDCSDDRNHKQKCRPYDTFVCLKFPTHF